MVSIIVLSVQTTTSEHKWYIGIYCMIFGLYWRIQLKRTDRWKGVLLYPLTLSFILCTAYFVIDIVQVQDWISVSHLQVVKLSVQMSWLPNMNGVQLTFWNSSQFSTLKRLSFVNDIRWISVANNGLYTVIDFISQLILVSCVSFIYIFFSRLMFFFPSSEALSMLDHVAPTSDYGYPMYFIAWIFRYWPNENLTEFQN